jgi:ABC-type molybdenum transport system ATPase subunit/photorepair protein PhrA
MTHKTIKMLIFLSIIGAWSSAFACAKSIEKNQLHQKQQIKLGVKTGQIDRRKFRQLKRGQKKVIRMKKRALLDDGHINTHEARKIAELQRKQRCSLKKLKYASH